MIVSNTYIEEKEGKIYKTYFDPDYSLISRECFVSYHKPLGFIPTHVYYDQDKLVVVMDKATTINEEKIKDKEILHVISSLASLQEKYCLLHGDIKPDNIVRYNNKLTFIDFEHLVREDDFIMKTQSFVDEEGLEHRNNTLSSCDPVKCAMYSLGITICLFIEPTLYQYIEDCDIHTRNTLFLQKISYTSWYRTVAKLIGDDRPRSFNYLLSSPILRIPSIQVYKHDATIEDIRYFYDNSLNLDSFFLSLHLYKKYDQDKDLCLDYANETRKYKLEVVNVIKIDKGESIMYSPKKEYKVSFDRQLCDISLQLYCNGKVTSEPENREWYDELGVDTFALVKPYKTLPKNILLLFECYETIESSLLS